MKHFLLGILLVTISAEAAVAKSIRSACLQSDRGRGKVQLCSCIQQVANRSLTRSDQKKVAVFFTDPDRAQRVRTSDSRSDERFWERYEAFGENARALCRQNR